MGREQWQKQAVAPNDRAWLTTTLEATPFFKQDALIAAIAPKFESYAVAPGVIIVQEGISGNDLFLIQEGTVSVSKAKAEVSQLGPGNYFGEMAMLVNEERRSATVTALERCRFFVLRGSDFRALLAANPQLKAFMEMMAKARKEGFSGG